MNRSTPKIGVARRFFGLGIIIVTFFGAASPSLGQDESSFQSLCQKRTATSQQRRTINALLLAAGGTYWWNDDCAKAQQALLTKTELNLSGRGISDLGPLVSFPQILRLNLKNNLITDVTPLLKLKKLQWIDLRENRIKNAELLESMSGLKTLLITE